MSIFTRLIYNPFLLTICPRYLISSLKNSYFFNLSIISSSLSFLNTFLISLICSSLNPFIKIRILLRYTVIIILINSSRTLLIYAYYITRAFVNLNSIIIYLYKPLGIIYIILYTSSSLIHI